MSEEKKDDGYDIIIIICLIVGAIFAVNYFFGDFIKMVYLTIKMYQLKLVGLIYLSEDMKYILNVIETKDISTWKWSEIFTVGSYTGNFINWIFVGVLGYIIYRMYSKNPYKKLTRNMDMFALMDSEKKLWPYLIPIMHVNLLEEKLDEGPYSMALKPIEFINKYTLLEKPNDLNSLNKLKTEKLLASQLGKLFDRVDKLDKVSKALFGIFASQAMGEKWENGKSSIEEAREVVKKLAESCAGGKQPNYKLADELVQRYKNDERVLKIMNKNAYVYTALGTLYKEACTKGVLPPNNLLWLKFVNRKLFYFLNCVGRRVCYIEVAGIFGHWKAEQVYKRPIERPYVINAREGIEKALQEIKLVDE